MADREICAGRLHEIAVNSGRPHDEAEALVRRFAQSYDAGEVARLQGHLQRELGKLKPGGAPKVVGVGVPEALGRLASVIETGPKALSKYRNN
jgi:hypothetical protein